MKSLVKRIIISAMPVDKRALSVLTNFSRCTFCDFIRKNKRAGRPLISCNLDKEAFMYLYK